MQNTGLVVDLFNAKPEAIYTKAEDAHGSTTLLLLVGAPNGLSVLGKKARTFFKRAVLIPFQRPDALLYKRAQSGSPNISVKRSWRMPYSRCSCRPFL